LAISVERKKHFAIFHILGKHCGIRSKRSSKEEGGYKNQAQRQSLGRIAATIYLIIVKQQYKCYY
jgi:hypothetical protein